MKRNAFHQRRGFTLVELLVVIAVIAIVVTIVVGVARIVMHRAGAERTRMNMQVIHLALDAFRDAQGGYPDEADSGYIGSAPGSPWTHYYSDRDWEGFMRAKKLYEQIIAVPQAQTKVASLSEDAVVYVGFDTPLNPKSGNVLADGFEKYMEYYKTAGVGGSPVLISAGADGNFDTEEDNIRSDGR